MMVLVLVLVLCYSIEMFFWGGGCCVSGVGDAASVGWGCCISGGGGAASMEGCCVSEEGYYKIIWFYFLNC